MEYQLLGNSGIKISQICLGTMNFGDTTDSKQATAILEKARQLGVNFIDTADGYSNGVSEKIIGKLINSERDEWVLACLLYTSDAADE